MGGPGVVGICKRAGNQAWGKIFLKEGFLEVAALKCGGKKKWGGWLDREYTVQRLRRER